MVHAGDKPVSTCARSEGPNGTGGESRQDGGRVRRWLGTEAARHSRGRRRRPEARAGERGERSRCKSLHGVGLDEEHERSSCGT